MASVNGTFQKTLRSYSNSTLTPIVRTSMIIVKPKATHLCYTCNKSAIESFAEIASLHAKGPEKRFCSKKCLKAYIESSITSKIKAAAKEITKA